VYLTATLPLKEEAAFFQSSGVSRGNIYMLRDCTTRRNVAYQVLEYDKKEEEEVLPELVEQKLEQYPAPGQIIIYCQTIKQCKQVGELLQCPMYFREVGSDDEKKKILQKLVEQKERVFAATNALGLGIDAPSIRVVMHLVVRDKVRDYGQESGRAGRDGKNAEAIVLQSYRIVNGRKVLDQGFHMEGAMQRFLGGEKCRRVSLDHDLDGRVDRIGCEVGEQRCDVCRGLGKKKARVIVNNQAGQSVVQRWEEAVLQRGESAGQRGESVGLGGEEEVNQGWMGEHQGWGQDGDLSLGEPGEVSGDVRGLQNLQQEVRGLHTLQQEVRGLHTLQQDVQAGRQQAGRQQAGRQQAGEEGDQYRNTEAVEAGS